MPPVIVWAMVRCVVDSSEGSGGLVSVVVVKCNVRFAVAMAFRRNQLMPC